MGAGMCAKCACVRFFARSPGLYGEGGFIVKPGRQCLCRHSAKEHTDEIYIPLYGVIASCTRGNEIYFVCDFGYASQASAERAITAKYSGAVIQAAASDTYLAIAETKDWVCCGTGIIREHAERAAIKNCRGRRPVVRLSLHTRRGEVVQYPR